MSIASSDTIPGLDVKRAKRYSRIRIATLFGQTALSLAAMAWFALSGRSARLRGFIEESSPDRRLVTPVYFGFCSVASWAIGLPVGYARDLAIERHFGLTNQTGRDWAIDQVKAIAVSSAIVVPLASGAFEVIRRRPRDWWLILATATVPVSVGFARLAPVFLMPLFNRFEELADRALHDRIQTLAERAGVQIAAVYRMDMSRQTEKPNAFFAGLGKSKRIVLSDTLLDRFASDEIEGIVAHELGHQVNGDIWRLIALGAIGGYGLAFATHRLAPRLVKVTANRSGVDGVDDVASTPVLALLVGGLGMVYSLITSAASRAIERRTDRFALELTANGEAYARALRKLATASLADPDPARWIVLALYSHPPIGERLRLAERFATLGNSQQGTSRVTRTRGEMR